MAEPRLIADYLERLRTGLAGLADGEDTLAEAKDHLCEAADRLAESGLSRADAEAEALRHFGSAALVAHAHVIDQRKGSAVATTFTRLSGLAGATLLPFMVASSAVGQANLTGHFGSAFTVFGGLTAFCFAAAFAGLLVRHRGALGRLGKAAKWVAILALPLSAPFGWGAPGAFVGWLALACALLGVGMWRAGVLPRAPLAALLVTPPVAGVGLGIGTLAGIDMGQAWGPLPRSSSIVLPMFVMAVALSWLGLIMWREPAVARPASTSGPLATA